MDRARDLIPASGSTRFAGFGPRGAAFTLLVLLALIVAGLVQPRAHVGPASAPAAMVGSARPADPAGNDLLLYRAIVDKLCAGEPYYPAAARLMRDNDYPLKPFVTMRLPTLAHLLAAMPDWAGAALLTLLGAGTIFAWTVRLGETAGSERQLIYASLLLLGGCVTVASPSLSTFHESWATLLVALSLALHRPGRWRASLLLGLAALLIRELALPYVLLMGALALLRRAWGEAAAWGGAALLFGIALALHAHAVAAVVLPSDPASPGWVAIGGLPYLIAAVRAASILGYLPAPLAAIALPLALLGWLGRPSGPGPIAGLYMAGFALFMTLAGRPDNFYWAAMIVPLLLAGLAFAPAALRDLVHALNLAPIPLARVDRSAT